MKKGILSLILFFVLGLSFKEPEKEAKKPNLIIILADDLGYGDVGFNGCQDIPTPNIDRIAQNGVTFTQGYVSFPVCGPSRAGLITGRYQDRFGFSRNPILAPNDPNMGLALEEETLAEVLKKGDYRNIALGKWHLGAHESQRPLKQGFDEFFGFLSGGHRYFPKEWTLEDISKIKGQWDGYKTKLLRNDTPVEEKEYLTDALSREAANFIRKDRQEPFFMYLAYNAPHAPLQATEKYLDRFSHIADERRRTYAAMVSAMDDGIGQVLKSLAETNQLENTIVVFLSDNGGPEKANASDNAQLRNGKGSLYEGGTRVPFVMQWPGQIPAGIKYEKPIISLDIFATMLAQTGIKANPEKALDGRNLLPYLQNPKSKANPHQYLFWRHYDKKGYSALDGKGSFKYLKYGDKEPQLFNLEEDISEANDLNLKPGGHSSEKKLLKASHKWRKELMEPRFLGLMQRKEYRQSQTKKE